MPRCLMMGFCEREKEEIVDGDCMYTSEEEREVGVQASSSTPALLRCVFLRLAFCDACSCVLRPCAACLLASYKH